MLSLKGKKILVTGGSRGIGKSCVDILSSFGAKVAFTHTASHPESAEKIETWIKDLTSQGREVKSFVLNLSEPATFKDAVGAMTDWLGGLDALVNNAGITVDQLMLRMKEEDFDKVMDVNVKGSYFLTKECLRALLKSESPSIVYISSVVGIMGNAGQSVYASAKAALTGLAKSLARELASRSVRVNVVAPGAIETDMTTTLSEAVKGEYLSRIALGRFGKAEEIAFGVAFLVSDMSRYVTGQVLNISGGLYI